MNLLVGTPGHELLDVRTAPGAYEIQALAGNDTVYGSGFGDLIVGGPGGDQMYGFAGDDVFLVTGTDPAADIADGGTGFDTIQGGSGNDTFWFNIITAVERIDGGGGNDVLVGTDMGNFWNFSQTQLIGIVEIDARGGGDQVTGSVGNERIIGGAGNDTLDGGAGSDTAVYSGNFAAYALTPQADGSLRVATTANSDGTDTIRNFEIVEFANGTYANGVFTPFGGPNTAPVAVNNSYAASEDTALVVNAASGVLANDSDADGDPLTVSGFDALSAQGGTVAMNANGSFTYTPVANFNGADSFSYTASDGQGGTATATVTVTVASVNDVPVALNNSYAASEDTALVVNAASGVLANDSDADGDPLTVSGFDALSAEGGTVAMNADGSFTYTPATGFTGTDTFGYIASDGVGQDIATVTLTVNPVQTLLMGTVSHDLLDVRTAPGAYEIQALAGNDTVYGSGFGDLIVGGPGGDQMYGFAGDDVFLVTGTDPAADIADGGTGFDTIQGGSGNDTFWFNIITAVERIDGGGGNDVLVGTDMGNFWNFSQTQLIGIVEIDARGGGDQVTGSVGNERIIGGAGNDTLDGGAGSDTAVYSGNFAAYALTPQADGSLRVATAANSDGTDTIRNFEIVEFANGTYANGVFTPFGGPNTAPSADTDSFSQGEDAAATNVTATLLAGDSDPDTADVLRVNAVNTAGTVGTVILTNAGLTNATVTYQAGAAHNALGAGQTATDTFQYTLGDGNGGTSTATVTVTVNGANDAPTADTDSFSQGEDAAATNVTATLLAGDSDPDTADVLRVNAVNTAGTVGTVILTNAGLTNATVTYQAGAAHNALGAGQTATDTFQYTLGDGNGGTSTATVTVTINGANDAPLAVNNSYAASEDTALVVNAASGVLANDSDADGDPLTVSGFDALSAQGGTVAMNANGSFTYTPVANFNGADSFSYTASDGQGGTATATVTVTVASVNDVPVALNNSYAASEDTALVVNAASGVLANDSDADGDPLTVSGFDALSAEGGTVAMNADGSFTYTPATGFTGTDTFGYIASDGVGQDIATVTLTVNPVQTLLMGTVSHDLLDVRTAPGAYEIQALAGNDTVYGSGFGDLIVGGPGGDQMYGFAGDDVFLVTGTDPAADIADGGTGFDTIQGGSGNDTFWFNIITAVERIDGGGGNDVLVGTDMGNFWNFSQTQLIGIVEIDARGGGDQVTGSVGNERIIGGAGNDTLDGGAGSDTAVYSGNFAAYALTPQADGSLRVATTANSDGTDTIRNFEIVEFANGTYANGVFTPFGGPNTAPSADTDSFSQGEDAAATNVTATLLAGDSDPDTADVLRVNAVNTAGTVGTVILTNAGLTNATVTYQAGAAHNALGAGQTATDTFQYTLGDGNGGTSTATVTVTINGANDAPLAVNNSYAASEDTALVVNAASGVLANDSDADGDPLTVSGFDALSAQGGTVAMNANGSFTYTPVANFNGADSFSYTASDGQGGTATATVTVTVASVNDVPVALNNSYAASEDTALVVNAASGVLANDSDADGDPLTVSGFDALSAEGGTVAMNADGSFTYTPATGFTGTDTFGYIASDGVGQDIATVTLTVNPVQTLLMGTVSHDLLDVRTAPGAYEIQALAGNDTVYGSGFGDLIVGGPGGDQMYGFAGDDVFLVTGTDPAADIADGGTGFDTIQGGSGNDTFWFNIITAVERIDGGGGNDVLVGTDMGNFWNFSQTQLIGIVEIDMRGADDQLTGSVGNERIIGGAGNDTLDGEAGFDTAVYSGNFAAYMLTALAGGWLRVATAANSDGTDTIRNFEIVEFANGTYANGVFTPFPDPNNNAPTAAPDQYAATEDTALVVNAVSGVLANDTDPDNDTLSIWSFDAQSAQGGTVAMNANGSFTYTPAANFNGSDSFSYAAADGRGGYSATAVTLTVGAVNDAPIAVKNTYAATIDTPLVVNAVSGVLANDFDPEGMPLTVGSYDALSNYGGTVAMNADGSFTYTPAAGFIGADSFSYSASDGTMQDAATVTVLVREPQPDAPEFEAIIASLPEGEWARVNTNQYQDVWTPLDQRPFYHIGSTPISIISAWSSAAWDDQRSEYIFWGGGHANYEGNEVYTWSAVTLQWERASLPSALAQQPAGNYEAVDGYQNAPISSHAYDNTEYLKVADRMIDFGGAAAHTGQGFVESDGVTRTGPYFWDPSKADPDKVGGLTGSHVNAAEHPEVVGGEMWENRETWKTGPLSGQMVQGTTDYVLVDGVDVVFVNSYTQGLFKYTVPDVNDPSQDTWEHVGTNWEPYNGAGAGAYDPEHNIYVRAGQTGFTFWNLETAGPDNRNSNFVPTDASGEFAISPDWGMEYDPVRDHFVLWDGNASVWYLEAPEVPGVAGWALEKALAPQLTAPVEPVAFNGVLGKWDYVEKYDVFIGVTDPVTGDVWAYKPVGWVPGDWML